MSNITQTRFELDQIVGMLEYLTQEANEMNGGGQDMPDPECRAALAKIGGEMRAILALIEK